MISFLVAVFIGRGFLTWLLGWFFVQEINNRKLEKNNALEIDNCLLTAHMGSMSVECRSEMEIQAVEDVIRCLKKQELKNEVPKYDS